MGETAPMAAARLALKLIDTEEELAAMKKRVAELETALRQIAYSGQQLRADQMQQIAQDALQKK